MKSVCAKHEQAYEDSCPYCEKKAEGPAAAPAAPPAASPVLSFTMNTNATAAAAAPVRYGSCLCKKFFLGPPGNYFDGRVTHTVFYCTAVLP